MQGHRIGYVRVSSFDQNPERQLEHMAYRNLTDAGLSPDEIAPRFGVSPLTVKRYLKLANISPAIFKLYAGDEMNFEQIAALALTKDHELQERIWNNTSEWQRNGATFRRLITETEINMSTNPLPSSSERKRCKGNAAKTALNAMRQMMTRLKLTVNEEKTVLAVYQTENSTSWNTPSVGVTHPRLGGPI